MTRIDTLEPETKAKALKLVALAADEGISLRITQAQRSAQEQDALYAQGRNSLDSVNALRHQLGWVPLTNQENIKVTNAKAGESWHNFHRAFDVVPMQGGVPDWQSLHWERIGQLGESVGLEWGGRWLHADRPHFQSTGGITLAEAREQGLENLA